MVQYYTNQPNTSQAYMQSQTPSQAQLQSMYGVGYNQPGTSAYTNYQQAQQPQQSTMSATNPLYIPMTPGSMDPQNYYADYSNTNYFSDPSIWDTGNGTYGISGTFQPQQPYPNATQTLDYQGTISGDVPGLTQPLGGTIYRATVPLGEDMTTPDWLSNPSIFDYQYMTDPSGATNLVAYSRNPLPGASWATIANPGYQDISQKDLGVLSGQGWSMYDPTAQTNQVYQDYQNQMDQLNNLIDQLSQPVEIPEVPVEDFTTQANQGQSIWEPFSWGASVAPMTQEGLLAGLTEDEQRNLWG